MKTSKLIVALAFAMLIAVAPAVGQSKIRATVPWDFSVSNTTLPAGVYDVQMQDTALLLMRVDGSGSAFALSNLSSYKNDVAPKLVFHRYGRHFFLREAWMGDTGRELLTSSREREYARVETPQQSVVVAALVPIK